MTPYEKQLASVEQTKAGHVAQEAEAQLKVDQARHAAQQAQTLYEEAVESGKDDALCLDLAGRARLAKDRIAAAERALEKLKATQAVELASVEDGLVQAAAEAIEGQRGNIRNAIAEARGARLKYVASLKRLFDAAEVAASVRRAETYRSGANLPSVEAYDAAEFAVDAEIPVPPRQFSVQG